MNNHYYQGFALMFYLMQSVDAVLHAIYAKT